MAKAAKWDLKKRTARLKKWLVEIDPSLNWEWTKESPTKSDRTPQQLVNPLPGGANVIATQGAVRVLEGDIGGWSDLRRAWQYRALHAYVDIHWFDQAENARNEAPAARETVFFRPRPDPEGRDG